MRSFTGSFIRSSTRFSFLTMRPHVFCCLLTISSLPHSPPFQLSVPIRLPGLSSPFPLSHFRLQPLSPSHRPSPPLALLPLPPCHLHLPPPRLPSARPPLLSLPTRSLRLQGGSGRCVGRWVSAKHLARLLLINEWAVLLHFLLPQLSIPTLK